MLIPPLAFSNGHFAGRFDQSVFQFDNQLDEIRPYCHALGVTEVDKNSRARLLKVQDWFAIYGDKGPRDDCGIAANNTKFKKVDGETHTVSHATYINERGDRTDTTECAFLIVQDLLSGKLMLLGEIHTPHGMGPELRANKVRSDVAKAYVQITRAYLRRARQLMRQYKIKYAALSGDWNLNFRFAWVRTYFRKNFVGWKMNWDYLGLPAHGTHGNEIIDGTLLKGLKPDHRKMWQHQAGDDHSGYIEHLVEI